MYVLAQPGSHIKGLMMAHTAETCSREITDKKPVLCVSVLIDVIVT